MATETGTTLADRGVKVVPGRPVTDKHGQMWKTWEVVPMAELTVEVYRRQTKIRKRERWGVRIKAANHLTLFASEKYVNHEWARTVAETIAGGTYTIIDEGA